MKNNELSIALLIGSIRKTRQSIHPAKDLIKQLRERGVKVKVLDLQTLDLPMFDDHLRHKSVKTLLRAFRACDGLLIVTPEYNRNVPSPLKNALDFARDHELTDKPIAVVGVSNGGFGGIRVIELLRITMIGLGALVVPPSLPVSFVESFDKNDSEWKRRSSAFLDQALRWFRVIKLGTTKEK